MSKVKLSTNKTVRPFIYCYTTPNDISHTGWCKIGYTEDDVQTRIKKQTHTSDTEVKLEWYTVALFDNGETFTDKQFHMYLNKLGIVQKSGYEWFQIDPNKAKLLLNTFKEMRLPDDEVVEYVLRDEQKAAIELAKSYMPTAEKKEFLINAKPRFGKTLTVYDYCKQKNAQNILIVTNRPVIAASWYDDYVKFLGTDEYVFVSNCDVVKDKKHCLSRNDYLNELISKKSSAAKKCIEFVSLQDLKGSKWFGGHYDKLREIADTEWDILIVDESHEGVDTFKTNVAFKKIQRKETIHLSGTPFKQIASERFPKEAIFNWTYIEEQEKKVNWDYSIDEVNPYENLPQLNLFTYRLDEMFVDSDALDENADRSMYFNLNEFFKTNDNGNFVNSADVDKFLDTISSIEKYPIANDETKSQIKHSLWLLDRVDSAKALAKKMKTHPKFAEYKIIVAAGDGKLNDDDQVDNSFKKVVDAIAKYDKTITISVGQLTTGVTIPEWSAVFMLCNVASPSLYIQASFRAQNPCLVKGDNGTFTRKENAYIFDFDPVRTLDIMEQFANDLYSDTSMGKGDSYQRATNIEKLIKYFPIVGENEEGELVNYTPEDIMTIPSKIQSKEIVRHGFMCNFLFQNVGKIFGDPKALEILGEVKEQKGKHTAPSTDGLSYDENGNTKVKEDVVQARTDEITEQVDNEITENERSSAAQDLSNQLNPAQTFMDALNSLKTPPTPERQKKSNDAVDAYVTQRVQRLQSTITGSIRNVYGGGIFNTKKVEKDIVDQFERKTREAKIDHDIEMERLRTTMDEKRSQATSPEEVKAIAKEFKEAMEEKEFDFACAMEAMENNFKNGVISDAVKDIETKTQEKKNKKAEEDFVYPKLKAFARSIPSFLMAYGDKNTTCDQFGKIIKPEIFKEMTGIELEHYMYFIERQYFNEIAFNDAIKEFFNVKEKLINYFDESQEGDIFDYIPPQKTNQIFTPKKVVSMMVDMLEENNPGCFDDPDKTFIDLYMKSGLYVAEIVKRLYRSEEIKRLFPDDTDRLRHIFKNQVYGLAPTEIIYNIAKNFVLGFDTLGNITEHNLKQFDATPYAANGTLEQELDKLFSECDMQLNPQS